MKTLSPKALWLGIALVLGLLATVLSFLYALVIGGSWQLFIWSSVFSLGLIVAIKLVSISKLDDERQLLVSAMLWELMGGVFGWTWIALALASFGLVVKALFFSGDWWSFIICLVASGVCKWLTRYTVTFRESTAFKQALVQKGLTKEEAREAWLTEARKRLQGG